MRCWFLEILCSIGSWVSSIEDVDKMIDAGMTIPRFNFSHIDYEKAEELMKEIKNRYPEMSILQDLQGNKLRVSKIFKNQMKVNDGETVYFCTENLYEKYCKTEKYTLIPISYEGDFKDLYSAKTIYMKDATMEFTVLGRNENVIKVEAKKGGMIRGEKGINAPGMDRSKLSLTEKDKYDIKWGLEHGVDIICLSYVTKDEDIRELKSFIKSCRKNNRSIKMPIIWSKIECRDGYENFDKILKVSDGIMIGRGDLMAEVAIHELPIVQEKIVTKMKKSVKDLIIATYVLDSLKKGNTPTIGELNDIYNFMRNKVNGFMLSGEVTISKTPIENIRLLKELTNKFEDVLISPLKKTV